MVNFETKTEIANKFNEVISSYTLSYKPQFKAEDIIVGDKVVTTVSYNDLLSQLFFRNYFPISNLKEYHHFTKLSSFENIMKTGCIRLSEVGKRFSQGEFHTFYDAHEMDGYSRREKNGIPLQLDIVSNSFFLSLTSSYVETETEKELWEEFGNNKGVRIAFKPLNQKYELRQIYYQASRLHIPLLKQLMDVTQAYERFLVFNGLSRIGFFFLPGKFSKENEYRLLIPAFRVKEDNLTINRSEDDKYNFIELPLFNLNSSFTISKIIAGPRADKERIKAIIANSPHFNNVPLE